MQSGILALFGVVLAAAIADILLPGKENSGVRRALNALVALTVLMLILRPVVGLMGESKDFFAGTLPSFEGEQTDFEAVFADAVSRRSANELEKGIVALLESDFGIENDDCTVIATLDDGGALSRVTVRLSGKGLLVDPEQVERTLAELLDCEVEVR